MKLTSLALTLAVAVGVTACATDNNATPSNKDKAVALITSLETGDQTPVAYINPNKYIQHNLQVGDGLAGFAEVLHHAPKGGFKAKVVRAIEDGNYVVTHTKYDFFGPKAGFDIFRFEDGKIVEHWDNLEAVGKPNANGNTQFNGPTEITDLDKTEANKQVVTDFINDVFINRKRETFKNYLDISNYAQHHVGVADGLEGLKAFRKYRADNNITMSFSQLHKVIGEGNFVLSVTEGQFGKNGGQPVAFYDLFRLENGKIVEHWDTIQAIPPQSEWKNNNGKFGFQ